jgi:hypothetical protein
MELSHEIGGKHTAHHPWSPTQMEFLHMMGCILDPPRETLMMMVMHSLHENTYINEWDI